MTKTTTFCVCEPCGCSVAQHSGIEQDGKRYCSKSCADGLGDMSSAAVAVRAAKHKSSSTCLDLNPVEEKTDQTKHIKGGDHTTTKLPD